MQVFDNLNVFKEKFSHCVATIGKYDGLHLGHQKILARVKKTASDLGLASVVILSEPQPEEFFAGDKAPVRLNHFNDKVILLDDFGIDIVYCMTFDKTLSQLSPEQFISDVLVSGLGIKSLIIGDDFRFGRNRVGDFELLKRAGKDFSFTVESVEAQLIQGLRVSSTLVRKLLSKGDCGRVKDLLGAYYKISAEVILGRQLGRQLGTPTANLKIDALPLRGVFAVEAKVKDKTYLGIANIGYKPTIDDELKPSLEVHLFNFNEDIYGEMLTVSFIKKIRNEIKFSSLDELKSQIKKDLEQAKTHFSIS